MESIKHKLGTALLILFLIAAAAACWYFISGAPGADPVDGTLVEHLFETGMGCV